MNILVLFLLLFLIPENTTVDRWLAHRRERWPMKTNDIVELAETTSGFGDFHQLLNEKYKVRRQQLIRRGTSAANVLDNAKVVRDRLYDMCETFLSLSYTYFARYMIEYYKWAEGFLNNHPTYETDLPTRNYLRDLIGWQDDHLFCALTAFFDNGTEVGNVLEDIFLSLALARDKNDSNSYPRKHLITLLATHRKRYENHFKSQRRPGVQLNTGHPKPKLLEVKTKITDFSDRFCPRWSPLVGRYLLSREARVNFGKHKSMFIRHVFENEFCEIFHPGSNSYCDNILESLDYGYEKYKESVTKVMKSLQKTKTPSVMEEDHFESLKSLSELREIVLKCFDQFVNAVNYYNIGSNVMLLVSIREGRKIIKGIRHVVMMNCIDDGVKVCVNEILGLRTTLSAFKSVLDHLVLLMLDGKRINVTDDGHKKTFDGQVTTLMELLDIRDKRADDGMSIRKMCKGLNRLDDEYFKAHLGDNAYNIIRFNEYYFIAPILNIKRLYLFYAYEFL